MQIQNYKIISLLGAGRMANVYLAYDSKFDTNVAIKLLNKEYIHNENIRNFFLAEAKIMFRMSHPNIIKVTDLIDNQNTLAFVMELVMGETLIEYINRKRKLLDEEIVTVFSQMLDAVRYIHSQKLVHLEINPSKFIITRNGCVKLMDFGMAIKTDQTNIESTRTDKAIQMDAMMYKSPEQIRIKNEISQSSDIYSLGVVLWQMVTGIEPYNTKTCLSFDLQMKIVTENLPRTNSVWDIIIEKATSKQLEGRYKSTDSFKDSFINNSINKNSAYKLNDVSEKNDLENLLHNNTEKSIKVKKNTLVGKRKSSKLLIFFSLVSILIFTYLFAPSSNKDLSFKEYKSTAISGQIWMVEDLQVTTFRNGDQILVASSAKEFDDFGNKQLPAILIENDKYFYNWFAVNDSRGLAPIGWRVASFNDWKILLTKNEGKHLKSNTGWTEGQNGTDLFGFNAKPDRVNDNCAIWWTSTEIQMNNPQDTKIYANCAELGDDGCFISNPFKTMSFRVRCIKNTETSNTQNPENRETIDEINEPEWEPGLKISYQNLSSEKCIDIPKEDWMGEDPNPYCSFSKVKGITIGLNDKNIEKMINNFIFKNLIGFDNETKKSKTLREYVNRVKFFQNTEDLLKEEQNCHLIYSNNRLLNIEISGYSIGYGAAHPINFRKSLNFDLLNGKIVGLNDVLNVGYVQKISTVVKRNLYREYGSEGWFEFSLTENSSITKEGIYFNYNDYEISPYMQGAPSVLVKWSEIKELLKENPYVDLKQFLN